MRTSLLHVGPDRVRQCTSRWRRGRSPFRGRDDGWPRTRPLPWGVRVCTSTPPAETEGRLVLKKPTSPSSPPNDPGSKIQNTDKELKRFRSLPTTPTCRPDDDGARRDETGRCRDNPRDGEIRREGEDSRLPRRGAGVRTSSDNKAPQGLSQ